MSRFFIILILFCLCSAPARGATISLYEVKLIDLARVVYGDLLHRSYIFDSEFSRSSQVVSVNWKNLSNQKIELFTEDIFKENGFTLQEKDKVLRIRKSEKIDENILVYTPRYRSARHLSDILEKVADAHQLGSRGMSASPEFQSAISKQPEAKGSASSQFDKSASDQLAYECMPDKCKRLRSLLAQLDTPEAQVMLRAAIYEVGTTRGEGSAVQIAASLLRGGLKASMGMVLTGSNQLILKDRNFDAVLSVLDQDGRFKSISRPMLRVKTGGVARFSVGQQVPVLGSVSQNQNGNSIQSVEYRQSGTIFNVQPDVRLDVVDLNITQELSNFVATTTGVNNSPTLLQRTASSQLSIKPGEVVVFAGLEEQRDDQADSNLFGFSLGQNKSSTTSEVLLFIEAQRI